MFEEGSFRCLVGPQLGLLLFIIQRCRFGAVLLAYSYSSTDIVLNMIKILLDKFGVFYGFVDLFAIYMRQSE